MEDTVVVMSLTLIWAGLWSGIFLIMFAGVCALGVLPIVLNISLNTSQSMTLFASIAVGCGLIASYLTWLCTQQHDRQEDDGGI